MIQKLLRKTLMPIQLAGYSLALFVGATLLLLIVQFYYDVKPIIKQEAAVFDQTTAVINKEVSLFKTLDKSKIYFSDKEIKKLKKQPFIKDLAPFDYAQFEIKAFTNGSGDVPAFYTDLFFESIPDQYLSVTDKAWKWQEKDSLIPIIIPENYLKLYNFGFAESQGLPVFSKNTIKDFTFNIKLIGQGQNETFKGRIVAFSGKINSILVPHNFMKWANKRFANKTAVPINKVLLTFNDPSDERIVSYFNNHNYSINQDKLALGKLTFFFKSALFFVFFIAVVILVLALAFVLMSINLMLQKNKKMLQNLISIGYAAQKFIYFYQMVLAVLSAVTIGIATLVVFKIRHFYLNKLYTMFDFEDNTNFLLLHALLLFAVVVVCYYILLKQKMKKII